MANSEPIMSIPISELGHVATTLTSADPNTPAHELVRRLAATSLIAGPPRMAPNSAAVPVSSPGSLLAGPSPAPNTLLEGPAPIVPRFTSAVAAAPTAPASLMAGPPSAAPVGTPASMEELPPRPPGLFGRIGHGLETAAKDIGIGMVTGFAPRIAPWIPGTPQNRLMREALTQREADQRAMRDWREAEAWKDMHPAQGAQKVSDEEQAFQSLIGQGVPPIEAYKQVKEAGFKPTEPKTPTRKAEFFMGPDGKPVQGYSEGGQNFLGSGEPLPEGYVPYKPASAATGHPVAGSINNNPAWGLFDPQRGWVDPTTHEPLKNFVPPPSWAEVMPATHTITLTNPETNLPTVYQYNPVTKTFSQAAGTAGTGTYAHQMQQAGASQRMIDTVKEHIAHVPVGTIQAWAKSYLLGTPIANSALAGMDSELMSVAALQPALHQFRSRTAMEAFEKIVGGLAKNPKATIASLNGLRATAAAINPMLPAAPGAPAAPGGTVRMIGRDGNAYEIPRAKVNQALKDGFRRR